MTIGQRIAQKRKELGLSQEALGDQLGVSRQSIYKWESDTALPEIDKLIALSRLYGVSVGWLLGVEDLPEPPGEAAGTEAALTEQQLRMVEEIAGRYIAAQPKPRKRRRWPFVAAGLILCLVLFQLFGRLGQMDAQYTDLQNSIYRVESSMDGQINSLSNRVEEILKAQNSLLADCGVELKLVSLRDGGDNGMALFSAYAVPKTYVEGMTAEFLLDNGTGGVIAVPAEFHPSGQTFRADAISCALTDDITLSVAFRSPDGTRQTQPLQTYSGLYSGSLPDVANLADADLQGRAQIENGKLTLPDAMEYALTLSTQLDNILIPRTKAVSIRVGLFKNQRLVAWAEPISADEQTSYRGFDNATFYRLEPLSFPFAAGDILESAAVLTDEYGREVICPDWFPLTLDSDGQSLVFPGSTGSDTVDAYGIDTDISHWTFQ